MNIYPAMKATMGRWTYFIVKMSMREVAEQVKFAGEIYDDKTLDDAIQRVLDESRVQRSIVSYLVRQQDRFFSSIVVAALEGNPKWYPVDMEHDERFDLFRGDKRLNETFGVLSFDGGQDYYALDGQHRLAAIRALTDPKSDAANDAPPGFKDEEISVIIVMPDAAESKAEFLERYRRLFGNLNRYAKPMDNVTNIIMDEDDAFAIVTRNLISNHKFFEWTGRQKDSRRVKTTKGKNLRSTDPYFTSLETLYAMNVILLTTPARATTGWDDDGADDKSFRRFRPSDEVLDALGSELNLYWNALLDAVPQLRETPSDMRDHSATDETETSDSLLFWPIGQELVAGLARQLLNHRQKDPANPTLSTATQALEPLGKIDWNLHRPPWRHVLLIPDNDDMTAWKMRSEDRKEAQKVCSRIVKWQMGFDELDEDEIEELRSDWTRLVLPALDNTTLDDLWQTIEDAAQR